MLKYKSSGYCSLYLFYIDVRVGIGAFLQTLTPPKMLSDSDSTALFQPIKKVHAAVLKVPQIVKQVLRGYGVILWAAVFLFMFGL
jgi:hypothetical protein